LVNEIILLKLNHRLQKIFSDHSSNDNDSETKDILLMGIETQTDVLENINIDSIQEGNIDIDA
jgi:hypothetical protein